MILSKYLWPIITFHLRCFRFRKGYGSFCCSFGSSQPLSFGFSYFGIWAGLCTEWTYCTDWLITVQRSHFQQIVVPIGAKRTKRNNPRAHDFRLVFHLHGVKCSWSAKHKRKRMNLNVVFMLSRPLRVYCRLPSKHGFCHDDCWNGSTQIITTAATRIGTHFGGSWRYCSKAELRLS